ncbi:ABC transporter substrate-binding protein [Rickettsiella grylli]|uniref:metal ABC transporter solute-binding protein, Zn/Mn family n=1 Tax=Rickettsiella grylli TaxID=59196 RepID=UPI0008FCE578|nr:zinc ABC transporter substrate-binding protein [Rickettsiella grylli]OIZ98984.1 ABC transporter substrate-binding protein [Rickettsiella grylli]
MFKFFQYCILLLAIGFTSSSIAKPIQVIAAENFYGDVAKEMGGDFVKVTTILKQPFQDPHLFSLTPHIAKVLERGDLIVYNGLGYDSWIKNLLNVQKNSQRTVMCVADLMHKKEGDNPHIWYDPHTMSVYAQALSQFLMTIDFQHRQQYQAHYQAFMAQQKKLYQLIKRIKRQHPNISVIATEPIFGYMAQALGFRMEGIAFQHSMMNGVEPSPQQVQDFQRQLQQHRVKLVFFNRQVSSPLVFYLLHQAELNGIPIIAVTETQPVSTTYYQWMNDQLKRVEYVLNERH